MFIGGILKRITFFLALLLFSIHLFCAEGTIAQYSTLNNLNAAKYASKVNIDYLILDGNFGIGTFAGLDGEMIILDGKFYRARPGGKIEEAPKDTNIPFAMVTTLFAGKPLELTDVPDYNSLKEKLLKAFERNDEYIAIKITGDFEYVKSRSIPAQKDPIPPLSEVIKEQTVIESKNISGTLVGFFTPENDRKYGSPDFHFHYINEARNEGGHLLELKIRNAKAVLCEEFFRTLVEDPSAETFHTKIKPMGKALEQILKNAREDTTR